MAVELQVPTHPDTWKQLALVFNNVIPLHHLGFVEIHNHTIAWAIATWPPISNVWTCLNGTTCHAVVVATTMRYCPCSERNLGKATHCMSHWKRCMYPSESCRFVNSTRVTRDCGVWTGFSLVILSLYYTFFIIACYAHNGQSIHVTFLGKEGLKPLAP